MKFKNKKLLEIILNQFKLDINGKHGIEHWERVYENALALGNQYAISSDIFELFALLHDSKREDEFEDLNHGKRAAIFVKELINDGLITLSKEDENRLIFACSNHTISNKKAKLYTDLIVRICFDADRLDIGRVGIIPDTKYFYTKHAKQRIENDEFFIYKYIKR